MLPVLNGNLVRNYKLYFVYFCGENIYIHLSSYLCARSKGDGKQA